MEVTLNPTPTPSEALVARAAAEVIVTDARGRAIKLKKPDIVTQYRFIEMLGDSARNQVFMGMVLPILFVKEIDGDAVFAPLKRSELDALLQRLDEDGIAAVMPGVQENFGAPDPEAQKAALKN